MATEQSLRDDPYRDAEAEISSARRTATVVMALVFAFMIGVSAFLFDRSAHYDSQPNDQAAADMRAADNAARNVNINDDTHQPAP